MNGQNPSSAVPEGFEVRASSATHVGHLRATNEDTILVAPPVYLVADGMGGHNAGEVASAIVAEDFHALVESGQVTIEQFDRTLDAAAHRIATLPGPDQRGAGTTVALVATMEIDGVHYWVVLNLGDSRVYRLSGEIFEQVSVDHSVVQELVDRGEITPEEARRHPYRNMITRALGVTQGAEPDYWLIPAEPGDRMLVCSDGLTGEVEDPVIERVLRGAGSVEAASGSLVELALDAGGRDNISVIVLEAVAVHSAEPLPDTAPRASTGVQGGSAPVQTDPQLDEDTWRRPRSGPGEQE